MKIYGMNWVLGRWRIIMMFLKNFLCLSIISFVFQKRSEVSLWLV
jgi:hypothetical protein